MTKEDKKRIEEIRDQLKLDHPLSVEKGVFLLAQLDEAHGQIDVLAHVNLKTLDRLNDAHAALRRAIARNALGEE